MPRSSRPTKRLRVRSKRLDQLDETKLALALWLMAKDELAEQTTSDAGATGGPAMPVVNDATDQAEAA